AGLAHEPACKRDAARATEDIAGAEIHQVAIAVVAVAGESGDQVLGADALYHRAHRPRTAMEGEVIDRRIEELLLAPHQAARAAQIVGEPRARIDKAVRDRERRMDERRHAVEECLHREMLEHLLVPVGLEADELARRLHGGCSCSAASRRATFRLFTAARHVTPLATAIRPDGISANSCSTKSVTPALAAMKPAGPAAVKIASTIGFSSRPPRSMV